MHNFKKRGGRGGYLPPDCLHEGRRLGLDFPPSTLHSEFEGEHQSPLLRSLPPSAGLRPYFHRATDYALWAWLTQKMALCIQMPSPRFDFAKAERRERDGEGEGCIRFIPNSPHNSSRALKALDRFAPNGIHTYLHLCPEPYGRIQLASCQFAVFDPTMLANIDAPRASLRSLAPLAALVHEIDRTTGY